MLSIRAARIIARISSSEYILEFDIVGSGTVASKSFRAGRPAGPVLIMMLGMLGKFLGDSFKFESVGPISSTLSSGCTFAGLLPTPGTAGSLFATKFAFTCGFGWPRTGGTILLFPAALVTMPPVDVRQASGVGTLELLVLMPDINLFVCRVNINRHKRSVFVKNL